MKVCACLLTCIISIFTVQTPHHTSHPPTTKDREGHRPQTDQPKARESNTRLLLNPAPTTFIRTSAEFNREETTCFDKTELHAGKVR